MHITSNIRIFIMDMENYIIRESEGTGQDTCLALNRMRL